jgi:hypothetical protein
MGDRQDADIIASKVEYDAPVPTRERNAESPFSRLIWPRTAPGLVASWSSAGSTFL